MTHGQISNIWPEKANLATLGLQPKTSLY